MFRVDRNLFRRWVEGKIKGLAYKCVRAELRLRRGETIVLTEDGVEFSRMRMRKDGMFEEFHAITH